MNYCNPSWANDGVLSPTDIQTVQRFCYQPLRDLSNFTFDAQFYLSSYPDLRAAFGSNYQAAQNHWNTYGLREGRRGSREFDVVYYLQAYPDLKAAFGSNYAAARDHWVSYGIEEGRRGSREVDAAFYLNKYPDLRKAYGYDYRGALLHWATFGLKEQRQASADFSVAHYFARYPDLRAAYGFPVSFTRYVNDGTLGFQHWVSTGIRERRNGRP
jgi:hypothetical protein